jgi:hypothetical protein
VEDRQNLWTSVALLALVGGAITALLYTERGRQTLKKFEASIDDFEHSLQQLRGAVQKASHVAAQGIDVATEGMQVVSSLMGKSDRGQSPRVTH